MTKHLIFIKIFLTLNVAISQTFNEKLITTINTPDGSDVEAWGFKYHEQTNSWVYAHYDTATQRYYLFDKNGTAGPFRYVISYRTLFSEYGDSYVIIDNSDYDSEKYEYIILKNLNELMRYEYINDAWVIRNGIIYFYFRENGKYYFARYNTSTGVLEKSRSYDLISYVKFTDIAYEGEPVGELGFTEDGREYYLAVSEGKKFIVTGETEGKKYSDIDIYSVSLDNNGELTYIAKSGDTFEERRGNVFVVQGNREYKKFDYIYSPVRIDKDNLPVYVGLDSIGEYKYRSHLMKGNTQIDVIEGGIWEIKVSGDGKIAYVKSREITKNNEVTFISEIIYGNWKSKKFNSVYDLRFSDDGHLYYTGTVNNKSAYYKLDQKLTPDYDYIKGEDFSPNGLFSCIVTEYGNYEKKIPDKNYYYIGNNKLGPYDLAIMFENGKFIINDEQDNYVINVGSVIDKDNYIYKYKVISNKFTSELYDDIRLIRLINGNVIFLAGTRKAEGVYSFRYDISVNNKILKSDYDSVEDFKTFNDNYNLIATRGNSVYKVEIIP
jgi:hypothetical protein